MHFVVRPETLTDGSTAYNVLALSESGETLITFAAADREHAARLMGALHDCAHVDVDVASCARTGTQQG